MKSFMFKNCKFELVSILKPYGNQNTSLTYYEYFVTNSEKLYIIYPDFDITGEVIYFPVSSAVLYTYKTSSDPSSNQRTCKGKFNFGRKDYVYFGDAHKALFFNSFDEFNDKLKKMEILK